MARVLLVQPRPGERISGGYLYNAELAAHGAWELCSANADELATLVPTLGADLVLADSIWLTEQTFAPFLEAAARGQRVGVLLHSFPSLIVAGEAGRAHTEPSEFELTALARVGLMIAPGPHCPELVAGHAITSLILPPGVDPMFRAAPRARTGPCRLISLGAVTRLKGYLDVLDALAGHAGDDFQWTVIGSTDVDPAYAHELTERARAFDNVTLLGQQTRRDVCTQLQAADVLVMPSYTENQPLVLLEALAACVPAVAYAAGGTASMLTHEREGLVCAVGDRAALGANLSRLIDDEPQRFAMAEACHARQKSLPSWPQAAHMARDIMERWLTSQS